jgi:hypothetical protein
MLRSIAAACAASALCLALAVRPAGAQEWNDVRSRALVERATERRAQQLADTGLKDFKALAHGYVTFLAQVGEGLSEPPKIVKADELMNEVYWLAPNLSKQRILGRRDTLLLPTDIAYHRDHLGIVQNNFPAIIRLGDGDEVIDVPHPLSTTGLSLYDFAITDSLAFQLPGRTIQVLEVKVRPKNDRQPRIVGAQALRRPQALTLAVSGLSEFLRFDRAEGFAFGGGVLSRFGGGFGTQLRARYGVDDHVVKSSLTVDWQSASWGVRAFAQRDYRDAGDIAERSRLVNSIAAQEFGSDVTDPYWVQGGGLGVDAYDLLGLRWRFDGSLERQHPLSIRATPAEGTFDPLVHALPARAVRGALSFDRPTALSWLGTELRANGELRVTNFRADNLLLLPGNATVTRGDATLWAERPFGTRRLAIFASGGAVSDTRQVIAQEWLYFGGPLSAPGYPLHSLVAKAGGTARAEWRFPVPAPAISLGRFGKVPGQATLAPFIQGTFIERASVLDTAHPSGGYPSAGLAAQLFFDILRVQVANGLRHGGWSFNLDVSRDFWGIL